MRSRCRGVLKSEVITRCKVTLSLGNSMHLSNSQYTNSPMFRAPEHKNRNRPIWGSYIN